MDVQLTDAQSAKAWRKAFSRSVDDLPDAELAWEADRWLALGARSLATICADVLHERRGGDLVVPGGASRRDLDALWARSDASRALATVRDECASLVAAIRLAFWLPPDKSDAP